MQSKTLKIILVVVIIVIVVFGGLYYYWQSWQSSRETEPKTVTQPPAIQPDLETYSSEEYSFSYPNGYAVTPPTESFFALTVEKARNKRVEIFQMKDFGDRPWGFSGTETQEEIDGYVPKETLKAGSGDKQYDIWLYIARMIVKQRMS